MLAKTVKTTNDGLWQKVLRQWIVAVVASLMDDNIVNQTVIIFVGPRGIGKTTWLKNLVSAVLVMCFYSGAIDPANKDRTIQLAECMLINLDELETMNKNSIG
jgi:predicted P-loop ATPase